MTSLAVPRHLHLDVDQPGTTTHSRPRIVFVDDEPGILQIWRQILLGSGYDVECCPDAASALPAIAAGCDCVITDYHMPRMSGLELIRLARPHTTAKFILLTANGSPELAEGALAAGAVCVVHKPTSAPVMLEKIAGLWQ